MKKYCTRLLITILLLLSAFLCVSSASAKESTLPPAVAASATLARGETELTVYSDTNRTEKLGKLKKGVTCQVLGISGSYYRVSFDGIEGYVQRSKMALKATADSTAHPGNIVTDLALEQYLYPSLSKSKIMPIHGTIQADIPLDTLFFFLWDERLQQMEHVIVKEVKTPSANLDVQDVCKSLEFPSMTAGRKTLLVQGASDGKLVDIYQTPLYICGSFKPIRNINDQCKFSAGKKQSELAGRTWTPSAADKTLTITLPEDGSAVLMTIEWRFPAQAYTVAFFDANHKLLGEETKTTGLYAEAVVFPPETRQVQLTLPDETNWVWNLCVYDENHPDNAVQQWLPMAEKLDLMVISPHQDDELLFYGGLIPYAAHIGADVGVVYMANCGRSRYHEALDGLWTAGLRNHPIFMHWQDQWGSNVNYARKSWSQDGADPQKEMVRLIRKYKPEVIVGPDLEGEYGHAQHKLTAELICGAIPLAMDESYDQESAATYGVWEVKKVYLHLYSENRIEMDWTQPFTPGSPISPIFLAKEAFDKHRTQQGFSMDRDGVKSDNRIFGLYYTAVGPDEAKNDIFEHINLE